METNILQKLHSQIDKLQEENKQLKETIKMLHIDYKREYDENIKQKADFIKQLKELERNESNPCMLCGSIQCAICGEEIDKLIKSLEGK